MEGMEARCQRARKKRFVLRGFEEDISDVFGYKLCPFMGTFGPWSFSLLRVPLQMVSSVFRCRMTV